MITFNNVGISSEETKSGRMLVYLNVVYNGDTYPWQIYVPMGSDIGTYLSQNSQSIENDIIRKESIWTSSPKTKIILNEFGNPIEIPVLKTDIIKPTIPDAEEILSDSSSEIKAIKRLLTILTNDMLKSTGLTQQHIDDLSIIHPYYEINKQYFVGDIFNFELKLYEVVQSHTSLANWYPPTTPALYKLKTPAGTISDWIQPTGAQDAYQIGDKVSHNGFNWISTSANNVWEPGVYGWNKI